MTNSEKEQVNQNSGNQGVNISNAVTGNVNTGNYTVLNVTINYFLSAKNREESYYELSSRVQAIELSLKKTDSNEYQNLHPSKKLHAISKWHKKTSFAATDLNTIDQSSILAQLLFLLTKPFF
jgi:hypothetical protein